MSGWREPYEKPGVDGWFCGECHGHLTVKTVNGKHILFRAAKVDIGNCENCFRAFVGLTLDGVIHPNDGGVAIEVTVQVEE